METRENEVGAAGETEATMSVSFAVDDVRQATTPLKMTPTLETVGTTLALNRGEPRQGPEAFKASAGPDTVVQDALGIHPLAAAVHLAFADHHPLALTPDAVWTTIAQGFALHIQLHAEELRPRFVAHEGKLALQVVHDTYPPMDSDWPRLVTTWCEGIREHVGRDAAQFFICDFTTSGPVARTVSGIVMMDAFERYFDYPVLCICGIPTITIEGTEADWREIRRRIELMDGYGLDAWLPRLREICDQFVSSAAGTPDRDFWQCIYKPREAYGGSLVTGWLSRLFPYVELHGFRSNRALTQPPSEADLLGTADFGGESMNGPVRSERDVLPERRRWFSAGVGLSSFPSALSCVPLSMSVAGCLDVQQLQLVGGLVGVEQHPETLALTPALGWSVRHAPAPAPPKEQSPSKRTIKFDQLLALLADP